MLPRASRSVARLCAFCHVCYQNESADVVVFQESDIPALGCIVGGSVPDAAVGCLARLASSGRCRRGASPTMPHQSGRSGQEDETRAPAYEVHFQIQAPRIWGGAGLRAGSVRSTVVVSRAPASRSVPRLAQAHAMKLTSELKYLCGVSYELPTPARCHCSAVINTAHDASRHEMIVRDPHRLATREGSLALGSNLCTRILRPCRMECHSTSAIALTIETSTDASYDALTASTKKIFRSPCAVIST